MNINNQAALNGLWTLCRQDENDDFISNVVQMSWLTTSLCLHIVCVCVFRITFDVDSSSSCDVVRAAPTASSVTANYQRSRRPSTPPPLPPLPAHTCTLPSNSLSAAAAGGAGGASMVRRRHSGDVVDGSVSVNWQSTVDARRACSTLPLTLTPAHDRRFNHPGLSLSPTLLQTRHYIAEIIECVPQISSKLVV